VLHPGGAHRGGGNDYRDRRESNEIEVRRAARATHSLLAARDDDGLIAASKQVKAMTVGHGADTPSSVRRSPPSARRRWRWSRNGGTAVQISGIEEKVTIDMELFEWDKIYINPLYGKCVPSAFPQAPRPLCPRRPEARRNGDRRVPT